MKKGFNYWAFPSQDDVRVIPTFDETLDCLFEANNPVFAVLFRGLGDSLVRNNPLLGNYVCRQCGDCLPCLEGIDIPAKLDYVHFKLTTENVASIPLSE